MIVCFPLVDGEEVCDFLVRSLERLAYSLTRGRRIERCTDRLVFAAERPIRLPVLYIIG